MKAPRYQLREAVVEELFDELPAGRFLELGYGSGDMLVSLSRRGLRGAGYDVSASAREVAARTLESNGVGSVELLSDLESAGPFDYLLFFEVIGYWPDPRAELLRLKPLLAPGGKLIFSFTNSAHAGAAERLTGNMRSFSPAEIRAILESAGFHAERIVNYGYPLANALKPALDLFHRLRARRSERRDCEREVHESGLATERFFVTRLGARVLNRAAIWPFIRAQKLFRDGDRGTGYVVLAHALV